MRFLVTFTEPVIYQAGHPQAERTITELVVSSATPRQAEVHALKCVQGSGDVLTVRPYTSVTAPVPVEVLSDVTQSYP